MPSPTRSQRPQGFFIFKSTFLIVALFGFCAFAAPNYKKPQIEAQIKALEQSEDQSVVIEALSALSELHYNEVADAMVNRIVSELQKKDADEKVIELTLQTLKLFGTNQQYIKLDRELNVQVLTKSSKNKQLAYETLSRLERIKNNKNSLPSLSVLADEHIIAAAELEKSPVPEPPKDHKELEKFLEPYCRDLLDDDPLKAIFAANVLSQAKVMEVVKILSARLGAETAGYLLGQTDHFEVYPIGAPESSWVAVGKSGNVAQAILNALYQLNSSVASNYVKSEIDFLFTRIKDKRLKISQDKKTELEAKLELIFDQFRKGSSETLINLNSLLLDPERLSEIMPRNNERAADVAKRVETYLNNNVVGQKALIAQLKNMEMFSSLYRGSDANAEHLLIMNAQNNGTDYIIRKYVDAINGSSGANKNLLFTVNPVSDSFNLGTYLGSSTGVVGSDHLSPLYHWLVSVSGGRYRISTEKSEAIVENPSWLPGDVMKGTTAPSKAVLHLTNLQNWSMKQKEVFLSIALSGRWPVRSPNGGVSEIIVPVRVIMTTTEGSDLIVPRNPITGVRDGRPSTFEEMQERYKLVANNEEVLREKILELNGLEQGATDNERKRGTELTTLRRIKKILLAEPYTEDQIREVTKRLVDEFNESRLAYLGEGGFRVAYDDKVIDYLHRFDLSPESQTGSLEKKIQDLIVTPILALIEQEKIRESKELQELKIGFVENADKTSNLIVSNSATGETFSNYLPATEKIRDRQPISDKEIDRLLNIDKEAAKMVVGVDDILADVRKQIVAMRDGRGKHLTADTANDAAISFMLLGLTSTGKTQTPKALAKALFGSEKDFVNLNFGSVTHEHDIDKLIFGYKDGARIVESDFIKQHRQKNGMMVVVLDELANIKDPRLLYRIYDLLREPVVGGFIKPDGSTGSLVMSNVIFIITGNATQEFWAKVPHRLPLEVKMLAYAEIAKTLKQNPSLVRDALEKVFPKPLLARIKMSRTYVVAPHTYSSIRSLAHMKLLAGLKTLAEGTGKRTWKASFSNADEYMKVIRVIEEDGYEIAEQGASIDGYVERLLNELKNSLYENKVPSGSSINITYKGEQEYQGELINGELPRKQVFEIEVEGSDKINFSLKKSVREKSLTEHPDMRILVGAHEAGHLLLSKIYFGNKSKMTRISIIPGVTMSGIVFEGVQETEKVQKTTWSRENILREMTVLLAGKNGQAIVSKDGAHDAGKQNDLERATEIAQKAILFFGASESWGMASFKDDMSVPQVLALLSEKQKDQLAEEVKAMITEADTRARILIENNFEVFLKLAHRVTELGDMREKDINAFFEEYKDRLNMDPSLKPTQMVRFASQDLYRKGVEWARKTFRFYKPGLQDSPYRDDLPRPVQVADIEQFARTQKERQVAEVPLPHKLPLLGRKSVRMSIEPSEQSAPEVSQAANKDQKLSCKDVL